MQHSTNIDLRRCTSSPCASNCVCLESPPSYMSYECKCASSTSTSASNATVNEIKVSTTSTSKNSSVQQPLLQRHRWITTTTATTSISHSRNSKNNGNSTNRMLMPYASFAQLPARSRELVARVAAVAATSQPTLVAALASERAIAAKTLKALASGDAASADRRPCVHFDPCKHGTCVPNNSSSSISSETNDAQVLADFTCECNLGYMGPFCDLMRHPCDFKPCENGVCEIVGDLYYKCLCKPNYTGVNCHISESDIYNMYK